MQVVVEKLTKVYRGGTRALDGVELTIGHGMFGLLGPNGAGKTTLMRTMATLLTPTEGTVLVDGVDVRKHPEQVRAMLGYLPQYFGLHGKLTAMEFLDYMAMLKGFDNSRQRHELVLDLLEKVNLWVHAIRNSDTSQAV